MCHGPGLRLFTRLCILQDADRVCARCVARRWLGRRVRSCSRSLTLLPIQKPRVPRPQQSPFRASGTPGTRCDGRHECSLQLSQSNISRCLPKFRSVTPPTWRSGSNAKLHVRFQKHGRDTFRPGYEFGTWSRWLRASALDRYRSSTCEKSPLSTFIFTTSESCSRYEVSPP